MQVTGPAARRRVPPARSALGQVADADLRLLRVFKAVVECGGMAAAERELAVGVSTISRQIRDLETRLGLVVCRRGRAGFELTADGRRVYDEALRLLGAVGAFRTAVHAIHRDIGGELHVAVFDKTATNPGARIAAAVARFDDRAPGVALHFHVQPIAAIERGVVDGRYQVGIIPAHRGSTRLADDFLFEERMQLYCGREHPLYATAAARTTWSHVRSWPFAGLGDQSPNMAISHRAKLTRKATGRDQESIATLILSGRYIGFLPDHYAAAFVADGRLRAVSPATLHYACRFVSVVRRSPDPSRGAELFRRCLIDAHGAATG